MRATLPLNGLNSKLRNTPYQVLASFYTLQSDKADPLTNSNDILRTFRDETHTDSVIHLNVTVETPTVIRNKTTNTLSNLSRNNDIQLVAIKAY